MSASLPESRTGRSGEGRRRTFVGLALLGSILAGGLSARGADLDEVERLFRSGRYEEVAQVAGSQVALGDRREAWARLQVEAEMARGEYASALRSLETGLRRFPASLTLRLIGPDVLRRNGRLDDAAALLDSAGALIQAAPSRFDSAEGRVALGRYFLLKGGDARKVLDRFFDVALKQRPDLVEAHLAVVELALGKQDNALAAATLAKVPKAASDDPRFHYLVARTFTDDDRKRSEAAIDEALKLNPQHVDSLILRADHRVDDEKYAEADELLGRALAVNPRDPRAWAYRAVLAHLRNDPKGEEDARRSALESWPTDPGVDHAIGRELSRKYRFAEGSAYQRKALAFDADYRPAKVQLCQDLLRLGDEEGGWKLAAEASAADPYDVVTFNLVTLRDALAGYRTLPGDGFVVRMDPREAELYGRRVLDLLARARKTLGERYGVQINEPVIVEIFPKKKEFAVRTFGLPGAEGFLGVCFGRVITANSPASQGETPSNWEAVLWHEYCHAVTLAKTRNKMPRWLSEGISVCEEGRQNPAWRGELAPTYRAMALSDDLTPLSQLSSAFLAPKSGQHLQFAYLESAMAVEFLVKKAGQEALAGLLDDLGQGKTIDVALPARAGSTLEDLDRDFATFARGKALAVAPTATWEDCDLPAEAPSAAIEAWLKDHPLNFPGLRRLGAKLMAEGDLTKARPVLERFRDLAPEYTGPDNAYGLLAALHRKGSDPKLERTNLEEWAKRDGDAGPAFLRLAELDEAAGDFGAEARDARRFLATNPLVAAPYRRLALAADKLGDRDEAIAAARALAVLDEADPAGNHFRLARLLAQGGQKAEARREVLKALEEAPRFVEAHRLLLELAGESNPPLPPAAGARR